MFKRNKRISFRIMSVVLIAIFLVAFILTYTCSRSLISAYENKYNDITLLCNRIVASNISGDSILPYIEFLKNDEELKIKQEEYHSIREQVYALEAKGISTDSAEMKALQEELLVFRREMQQYKDDAYYYIQEGLNELKLSSGAKYLYILADTGVPDAYTYIFDAHTEEEANDLDIDDLGTVDSKEGLEEAGMVLETGEQMEEAVFYQNGLFGRLNYAYAPIFDSAGVAVAVVGTDMDLAEMSREIINVIILNAIILFIIATAGLGLIYWLLRRTVISPINSLVTIGTEITDGKLNTEVPLPLRERKDEVGTLANTYQSVITSFHDMVSSTAELLGAAMSGRLTVRSDTSLLNGDFAQLLSQFNVMLDVIEQYSDNIPEALMIMDLNLNPLYQNQCYKEMFAAETSAKTLVAEMIIAEGGLAGENALHTTLSELVKDEHFTATVWLPGVNGQQCMSCICCKWEIGADPTGFLLVASDITELMTEKEKALAASKAKSEFLSRVSHELRTPLNTIVGMAALGLRDKDVTNQSAKRLGSIADASNHLLNIINDVLDTAQIEAGKAVLHLTDFEPGALMDEIDALLSLQAQEKNLTFSVNVDNDVPPCLTGDAGRLKQILVNLAGNAIKFTNAGGSISLSVATTTRTEDEAVLLFRVTDSGVGMSPEFLAKIFTPFEQEDSYIKRRYNGTGLGLSISFGLVTLMGGTIDVKSTLGEGSEFLVSLPFAIAAESNRLPAENQQIDLSEITYKTNGSGRILLVDDIDINRQILAEILQSSFEFVIDEASDGVEALEKFKNSAPGDYEMIFMDIQMPRMDGYHCTNEIRKLNRADAATVPIVAMTANAFKEDQEAAFAAGMNDHLAKPIDFERCKQIIYRYCVK